MTVREELQRRIYLKNQAIKLMRDERDDFKRKLFLLKLKEHLEEEMVNRFDALLSRKLDCLNFLLEN